MKYPVYYQLVTVMPSDERLALARFQWIAASAEELLYLVMQLNCMIIQLLYF